MCKNLIKRRTRLLRVLVTMLFCVAINVSLFAQNLPFFKQWDARFGGEDYEQLTCIKKTLDGGYILGGSSYSGNTGDKTQPNWDALPANTNDYWVVKTDSLGIKQWDKRFGGDSYEELYSVLPTADKGYLLAGSSYSQISGDKTQETWSFMDYWVIKIDSNGNKLWDRRYGGDSYDNLTAAIVNPDGSFLLAGYTSSWQSGDISDAQRGSVDFWVIKIDAAGNKVWNKRFGGVNGNQGGSSRLRSIASTSDGGYLLGGESNANAGNDKSQGSWPFSWGANSNDYWVIKINASGNKLWDRRYGGTYDDYLTSITVNPDGSSLIGGYIYSDASGDITDTTRGITDYWILKIDASGNKIWDKRFGGPMYDKLGSLERAADGGYFLGGDAGAVIGGDKSTGNCSVFEDFWLVRIDANGNKLWDRSYGGDSTDSETSSLIANDGGLLLGGNSTSNVSCEKSQPGYKNGYYSSGPLSYSDYWILKLANSDSLITQNEDKDGLNNYEELVRSTDPKNFDTNNDGLADGVNVFIGLPPLNTDTDGDAISNILELIKGTCPILSDTDADGVSDALDPFPLDRFRKQLPPINLSDHVAPVITLQEPSI